jgi:two-component system sensor histidine kinase/response regulator
MRAQDKGLELLFDVAADVPRALVGDPLRLGQVMINLTNNAIKFTQRGEIVVTVRVVERGRVDTHDAAGERVRLRVDVRDTGPGLTPEQQARLFQAFTQADTSTTRHHGGTGLGLTISKRLVELMDGQIGLESQPGVGSNFYFTASFGVAAMEAPQPLPDVSGLRVLVVDDNASAREIFLGMLSAMHFAASSADSGQRAVHMVAQARDEGRPYNIVLMDWQMPGMNGIEAIQAIQAEHAQYAQHARAVNPAAGAGAGTGAGAGAGAGDAADAGAAAPPAFVIVTAYNRDVLVDEVRQLGEAAIAAMLNKPVSASTLLDSISSVFGKDLRSCRSARRRDDYLAAEQSLRGARLLLVEDNEVNQEVAQQILNDAGIHVDIAHHGAMALAKLAVTDYDGVLMDCQMPVMDGYDATRKLREEPRLAKLPVIAMTANAMVGDKEKCLAAGMNDFIAKPIDVGQLFTTLARWITVSNPLATLNDASGGGEVADTAAAQAEAAPAAAAEHALPAIPGLRLEAALQRVGGNVKLMRKLLARFVETQADAMARIDAAIENNDLAAATREAHTVKGLAGNIGASGMADAAARVEQMLGQGVSQGRDEAVAAMDAELCDLIARIAMATSLGDKGAATAATSGTSAIPAVSAASDGAAPQTSLAELAGAMQDMARLLAQDDGAAVKQLELIAPMLAAAGQAEHARQLKRQLGQYDFEGALDQLKAAASALDVSLPV